jgi:hypothetical protein
MTPMTRHQNMFGRLLDLVERHKTNELAGTKTVGSQITNNLYNQVALDDFELVAGAATASSQISRLRSFSSRSF